MATESEIFGSRGRVALLDSVRQQSTLSLSLSILTLVSVLALGSPKQSPEEKTAICIYNLECWLMNDRPHWG